MEPISNSYAFLADFSSITNCLSDIYLQEANGVFFSNAQVLTQLRMFEAGVFNKLYQLSQKLLIKIGGTITITGQPFSNGDFYEIDFSNADFLTGQPAINGDFDAINFSDLDFLTGQPGNQESYFVNCFRLILSILGELGKQQALLQEQDKQLLDIALLNFLDGFDDLQRLLESQGLNPCNAIAAYNNSPDLFLHAAGSDQTNDIAAGIHLRWGLAGELGNNHLPQGNYSASSIIGTTFQRPDDFVQLYRIPYSEFARITLDLETAKPVINYSLLRWTYFLSTTIDNKTLVNRIYITFTDQYLYRQTAAQIDPQSDAFEFLKQYNGILELEVSNKTSFAAGVQMGIISNTSGTTIKLDAICLAGTEKTFNSRQTVTINNDGQQADILGDNITSLRLAKMPGVYVKKIIFETYDDFVQTRKQSDWVKIGQGFGLSLDDTEVYERLESDDYLVDNRWPAFNKGTKVRVSNYHDKWSVSRTDDPSIREMVEQYLHLSATDPRAEAEINDSNATDNTSAMTISYLDMLNLMATDYHIARMLGLGHIDTLTQAALTDKYIYKAVYANQESLSSTSLKVYTYLSLPTSKADLRLSEAPILRSVSYNMPVSNQLNDELFDQEGYTTQSDIRIVNIGRQPYAYEAASDQGILEFNNPENFNLANHCKNVFYGIEYRAENQSAYVKPQITNEDDREYIYYSYDEEYPAGIPEIVPVPDNTESLYIHFEKHEGVHYYAAYGIDLFSRASAWSNEVATNATHFAVHNTLVGPTDMAVQYIQPEDTLLFTTSTEQSWLAARAQNNPNKNVNFTRVSFNWLDITDISHLQDLMDLSTNVVRGDHLKGFFRQNKPAEIAGIITAIENVPDNTVLLKVFTGSYALLTGEIQSPAIDAAAQSRFIGSQMVTDDGYFTVVAVDMAASGLVLTIQQNITLINVEDTATPNTYATAEEASGPAIGSRFTVVENLSNTDNWNLLSSTIKLLKLDTPTLPIIESSTDSEGNVSNYLVGGLTGKALVKPLTDISNADQPVLPGYYAVTFESGIVLPPHPQAQLPDEPSLPSNLLREPYVDWYKGLIRVPAGGSDEKKLLEVVRIIQTLPLTLYVYDPTYADNSIQVSASSSDWISSLNYHPGYKAYLFAEPEGKFNSTSIEPVNEQLTKKTLIGLQSSGFTADGQQFDSRISLPAVLMAKKEERAIQPEMPLTYGLRVRPNVVAKAAFTFDSKIAPESSGEARMPFGYMFYRTSLQDVLYALYNQDTVTAIQNSLDALTSDLQAEQRYADLVNLVIDPATGIFPVFDAKPQPYGFPSPDHASLTPSTGTQQVYLAECHAAIRRTLLPLTAQTPICSFIKSGYQTENTTPKIRSIDGALLDASNEDFNPFPMIRKYSKPEEPDAMYLRFTDYTLNASSRDLYFYTCSEVTSKLAIGEISPFAGPVAVVHTLPASAPVIRSYSLNVDNTSTDEPVTVNFKLSPFNPEEPIFKVRIYRTLSEDKASSLQSMESYTDVSIINDGFSGLSVTDSLTGLNPLPLGETLYMRLAYIRSIINEKEELEDILSLGSDVFAIRLIDNVNPPAPELTYIDEKNKLTWVATANKSVYYLYQQNPKGNWQKIFSTTATFVNSNLEYIFKGPLNLYDEAGNRIYYRFKVKAENSSGLMSLIDKELTV